MDNLTKLKYWTFKILPLVYDDSLSYYEVLTKVTNKVNELVDSNNTMPQAITDEITKQLDESYATDINNKINSAVNTVTENAKNQIDKLANEVYAKLITAIATDEGTNTFTKDAKSGGELIFLNNTLYKVTAVMPAGTNYIIGTNIVTVDISKELKDIKETYLTSNNEHWNDRSTNDYNTGVYLYWKDILYVTTKDIKTNDILYADSDNQNLKQVTLASEIINIQKQIYKNDNDIDNLQENLAQETSRATNRENFIDGRISNIVAQSGNDNTEIVDARIGYNGTKYDTLGAAIRTQVNNVNEDIIDLDNLFNWGAVKTNILNRMTPVVGEYVDYSNGLNGPAAGYEWYEISVTEGQTFKYNGNNAHVAFFSKKYDGSTVDYYLSGLLTQENIAFTVPKNAVSMTLSVPIDYPNWLGNGDEEYRQNTTIKKEHLPEDKQIIVGGSDGTYTNIVKAVKECEEYTTIIVRSGSYDLEAQFKEVYGDDFFVNYKGYTADSNFELSGLYLKRGVKLIADSGTVLSFMYSGNNPKVSEEFSPINMSLDNIVDGLIIEVNSNVRYHIHDDFAFQAVMNINNYGRNEIKNCIFKGNSTAGSVIGGGMGTHCKYIIHDNYFENTVGNAVTYHNSSFPDAQNFIDIFNNYAETPIALHWYGASTKITTALVHNNTASLIECSKIPNYDAPNENIKMKAWNNNIV